MIRHKFHAKPTTLNNIHFASKKEGKRYLELEFLKSAGDVLFFLRQTPLHLPGGVKYICDFLVFWSNGEVTFEDVKGMKTETYQTKKKIIESMYPIEIKEI